LENEADISLLIASNTSCNRHNSRLCWGQADMLSAYNREDNYKVGDVCGNVDSTICISERFAANPNSFYGRKKGSDILHRPT
jgi:hypothetical protein